MDAVTDYEKLPLEVLDNVNRSRTFLRMLTEWDKVISTLLSDLLARSYYLLRLDFRRLWQKA